MGSALLIGGIAMWVIDAMNAKAEVAGPSAAGGRIHTWHMEEMSLGQAIWIGACPDPFCCISRDSRSMSTIGAGQFGGKCSRASALEFSFFLSIPTMVVATCYDLLKSLRGKSDTQSAFYRSTRMDGFCWSLASWFRRGCLRFGGVVHGLCAATRFRAVRRISNYRGIAVLFWRRESGSKNFISKVLPTTLRKKH